MTTEKPVTEKPTTEEVTTEETMTEKPTSEAKKKDTDEVAKEKEDAANSDKIEGFSFVDTKGRVNISSQAFMDYYFSGNRRTKFANIKQGITRNQVEAVYDKSQGVGQSAQTGVGERYGDIVVVYNQQDIVDTILLNPTEKLNVEDIRRLYGEPTLDEHQYMKEGIAAGKGGAYMPTFIYDGNNQNGYHVSVTFTGIDVYVRAIETDEGDLSPQTTQNQTKDETVQNHQNQVTEEQVRAFVLKVGKPDEVNDVDYKLHHIEGYNNSTRHD
ncbi:hypothetical protein [Macrococcus hajekii]|nr:hypothetical protein [Macrococcus hajekii]